MYQRKSDGLYCEKMPGGKVLTSKSKKVLKEKVRAYNSYVEKGMLISEALDKWIASRESELTNKGLENYRAPLKRLKDAFGDRYANELHPDEIQAFVNGLKAKGYNISVVKRPLYALDQTYQWMMRQPNSPVHINPCSAVKVTGMKQESRDLANRADIEKIKNGLSHPWGLLPYFMLYTGLREQEALALKWSDIDFENKKITINKALEWPHNQPVIKETKNESSVRYVTLLDNLEQVLPKNKRGYIFHPESENRPYTKTEFKTRWLSYCKDMGLCDIITETHYSPGNNRTYEKHKYKARITPHQLRHEYAAMCVVAKVDIEDAAAEMGHSNTEMTRKYANIEKLLRKSSIGKLSSFVAEGGTVELQQKPKPIDIP